MKPFRRVVASAALTLSVGLVASTGVAAMPETPQPTAEVVRHQGLEKYALKLLNCNRTGGKIRRDGSCKARGSGRFSKYHKPLLRHRPIGTRVAFPWARTMVIEDQCKHELEGFPGVAQRFGDAGFGSASWGENIGCTWGYSPRDMVVWVSRAFQAERRDRGGHWRNLKNDSFRSVGIGVAVSGTRATIVFDFYGRKP